MFMLTRVLWEECITSWHRDPFDYFMAMIGSVVTIPLDIALSPIELIAWIIYKVRDR